MLLLALISLVTAAQIQAVSLGGHLVPEPFIGANFWDAVNQFCPASKDIWNLCECTNQNSFASGKVKELMKQHLQNFINITDLEQKIIKTNINTFRYPISFTYFIKPDQVPPLCCWSFIHPLGSIQLQ